MYSLHNNKKGFTLVEVMLSSILGIIIIIALLELLTLSFSSYAKQSAIFSTTQEMTIFMMNFTKDIHNSDTLNVTDNEVDITVNNERITYVYTNRTVSRNSKILMTEVDALKFTQNPTVTGNLVTVTLSKKGIEMRTTVYAK